MIIVCCLSVVDEDVLVVEYVNFNWMFEKRDEVDEGISLIFNVLLVWNVYIVFFFYFSLYVGYLF